MKITAIAILCLTLCGCAAIGHMGPAGIVYSRRPYSIQGGTIVQATPKMVRTEWPRDRWFVGSGDLLYVGDDRSHVCPDTVPRLGSVIGGARLTWDKARKCWLWRNL